MYKLSTAHIILLSFFYNFFCFAQIMSSLFLFSIFQYLTIPVTATELLELFEITSQ